MPTRRKNADINRIKRSSKRSKFGDFLSSPYVQYLFIFLIWGALLLINQSTEMRFEYFWPTWLFICSIHDSMKYQGLQYTIVFIIIVITVDLICFFLFPASWIYSCGSAYVWVYLLWHTDQGLCFLTLTFCFVFVYFELGFYSRDAKLSHSIYLFRPFAAHSIGYPVVCMGFSIKRYLDIRHRKFKKLEVRRQNFVYFRIMRDALPSSAINNGSGLAYSSIYLPEDPPESIDGNTSSMDCHSLDTSLPWSLFLLHQIGKSFCAKLCHWTSLRPLLSDRESSSHTISNALRNGTVPVSLSTTEATGKRSTGGSHDCATSIPAVSNTRRHLVDGQHSSESQVKSKQSAATKHGGGRSHREDPTVRLENNVRRLRTEVQSMRAVESQLRNQLTHLERQDRLNRLCLSDQREKHESLSTELSKLASQCRSEKSNLTSMEHNLAEETRLRQSLEEQLTEAIAMEEVRAPPPGSSSSADESQQAVHGPPTVDESSKGGEVIGLVTEASCCQRRHALESDVYNERVALRQLDEQIRLVSAPKGRQNQPNGRTQSTAKHTTLAVGTDEQRFNRKHKGATSNSTTDIPDLHTLQRCLQKAKAEAERLTVELRQQNWMKQELLTSYHTSVRDINELNKTHKQRDLQILELTMKAEQLECLSRSKTTLDRVRSPPFKRDMGQIGIIGEKRQAKMSTVASVTFPTTVCSASHSTPQIRNFDGELSSYPATSPPPQIHRHSLEPSFSATTTTNSSFPGLLNSDKCGGSYNMVSSDFGCPQSFLTPTGIGGDVTGPNSSSTHFTESDGCSDLIMTKQSAFGTIQRLSTETH